MKHYGFYSCSPIKPTRERELTNETVRNPQKSSTICRDILSSLVRGGADLEGIGYKAEQLLNHTCLSKLRNNKTEPNEFTELI